MTNVEIVEADARVICVSNKIKHLFEFDVKVNFALTVDESMGLQPQAEVRVCVCFFFSSTFLPHRWAFRRLASFHYD